eukprot:6465445-Amphidinium_carterae.1
MQSHARPRQLSCSMRKGAWACPLPKWPARSSWPIAPYSSVYTVSVARSYTAKNAFRILPDNAASEAVVEMQSTHLQCASFWAGVKNAAEVAFHFVLQPLAFICLVGIAFNSSYDLCFGEHGFSLTFLGASDVEVKRMCFLVEA